MILLVVSSRFREFFFITRSSGAAGTLNWGPKHYWEWEWTRNLRVRVPQHNVSGLKTNFYFFLIIFLASDPIPGARLGRAPESTRLGIQQCQAQGQVFSSWLGLIQDAIRMCIRLRRWSWHVHDTCFHCIPKLVTFQNFILHIKMDYTGCLRHCVIRKSGVVSLFWDFWGPRGPLCDPKTGNKLLLGQKERISWSGVLRMKYWVTQNSFLLPVLNFEYHRL